MKLVRSVSKFKLSNFKAGWLKIISRFKLRQIWERLTTLSTVKNFGIIFVVLILLTGLEFIVGYYFIFGIKSQLIKSNQLYDKNAEIIYQLQTNLANLPVVYNDELSGIATISSKQMLYDIHREMQQLSVKQPSNHDLQLFKASLTKIDGFLTEPVIIKNYYEIWAEAGKAQTYLGKFEKQLHLQRQKQQANGAIYKKTWTKELLFLVLIFLGTICLFIVMIREGKSCQSAVIHFEEVAKEFKRGQLQPGVLRCQTSEFKALQVSLNDYLKRLAKRYQIILGKINEFGPPIQQLAEWIAKNDNQQVFIKQNLKGFTDKIYQKLEKFPDLSEQIKHINFDLNNSQQQAGELQELIGQSRDLLHSSLKSIHPLHVQVTEKGEYYQAITAYLKELKVLLDELQQTVTSFYGISEQTNLLALNASIEAARAGELGDNFSLAATEIEELAVKINKASKELLNLSVLMGKKTNIVIRILETSLSQNKLEGKYLGDVVERVKNFVTELTHDIAKIKSFSNLVQDFEAEEQGLEKLANVLSALKQQAPSNHGRAMAALEVIDETDKLVASAAELDDNLTNLKQALVQIQYTPNSEEF